ncbi:MAG: hypothetical protein LBN00_04665 [Oscillospiraceae bacterium]|jgi:hypoxanthine phosphoribosyltransferase|nr:hypothetical protein [Oscillospiraceae bacterium]
MDKDEALESFYRLNKIDKLRVHNPDSADYDKRIEELPEKLDKWLASVACDDREIFLRLFSRYTYITPAVAQERYERAVVLLKDKLAAQSLSLSDVLFITVEAPGAAKSGSDNVRTDLHRRTLDEIDKEQIIASCGKLKSDVWTGYKAIVFVDDIVGTGFTLSGEIKRVAENYSLDNKLLYYICLIPTRSGIRFIKKKCKEINIIITPTFEKPWILPSAFKENFTAAEEERVRCYEEIIDAYMKEPDKTFVMGFYESKQLISFYYNTPNNTLCCFWKESDIHTPLFKRQGQRPTLSDLKDAKTGNVENAYAIAAEKRRKGVAR